MSTNTETSTPVAPEEDEFLISVHLYFKRGDTNEDTEQTTVTFTDACLSGSRINREGARNILTGLGFANLSGTDIERVIALAILASESLDEDSPDA